ncbi:MAG: OmpA family protein [Candidatus Binatia bacterium]
MEKLKTENMKLIAEKGALAEEVRALNTEINGRDKEIKNLRTKIQSLGREAEKLAQKQQKLLEQQMDQSVVERTQLSARLKEIETEMKGLREAKEKTERTIEIQRRSISSLKDEIAAGQNKIAQLAETRETLQETIIEREQTLSELAQNQRQLLEQLSEDRAGINMANAQVEQSVAERTQLSARFKEIKTEAEGLREAKEKTERTIEIQRQSISSLKGEIAAGQINMAQLAKMAETLRGTKIKREQTISELTQKQRQLLEQLDKAQADKSSLNKIIESHQRQGEKYQERLTELSKINHDLQQRMKTFLEEVNKGKAYTQQLMIEKTQLMDQLREGEGGAKELTEAMEVAKRTVQIQQQLIASLRDEVATGQIKIVQLASRVTIHVQDNILFDSGKASLKPSGVAVLKKIGKTLQRFRDRRIQIEGHTDSRSLRWELREKYPTNWELSAARAAIVVRYLIDDVGIEATRLSAVGYASYQPVASNDSPEGQQENRRVEIAVLPLQRPALENMK